MSKSREMKDTQVIVRMTKNMKRAVHKNAKDEGKSINQYMSDVHVEHCERKRLGSVVAIECTHCGTHNSRGKVKCVSCGNDY